MKCKECGLNKGKHKMSCSKNIAKKVVVFLPKLVNTNKK